jgi:hypothetical protein
MANVKSKQGTKPNTFKNTKKKKKQEEDRLGRKGQSQARQKKAQKTGADKLKKTDNARADERREGAARARQNQVNVMRSGAQNYIVKDKAQKVATAPTRVASGALKNSQNTAGLGRGRRSGAVTNTTKNTTRLTKDQSAARAKAEEDRRKKIAENKKRNDKNGYAYGNKAIKALDKYNATTNKKFEESKKKDLEYGASALSDEKVNIPIYTKYAKNKAEREAKAALKKGGVTQKGGIEQVDKWVSSTEKDFKSKGYDVKDDTVVTDDGKTWGQVKQEAYDQEAARIRAERSKYIHQSSDNAGKISAQDIYKAAVPMASEFIDYGVPYMATAKGSIKVAEKLMSKAVKAGKAGKAAGKAVPKIEKSIDSLVDSGKLTPQAAKALNRRIAVKSGAKSVSTELVANALQDATIGTAIDLGKGLEEGLEGKDLQKYMRDNAIANLALGVPMSAVAGRAGAKEAKLAMAEATATDINKSINLSRAEGIELDNLMKKSERGIVGASETERMLELQDKALGGGKAVVNSQGKIEVNNAENAIDGMSREEARDYISLRAQAAAGTIKTQDMGRLATLQGKVEQAYKETERAAEKAINISGRKVTSLDQPDIEKAVSFYERTGNTGKLKQAQEQLERAKVATAKKNKSIESSLDTMKDVTKGKYRWVSGDEMEAVSGNRYTGGYYDTETGEVIVNRDSPQAYQTVIGHETMHMMKEANREGYDKLANSLKDYVKELGDYDDLVAEVKRAYPEETAGGDVEALDEELVSEMLGRYVFGEDDRFIKKLAGEEPTILQRIIAYIKQFINESNNAELAEQFAKIEKSAIDEIKKAKKADWEKRGLEEVTGKEKEKIIKKSQFTNAPISAKDGMYSYAYEAAGKLGKTVKSDADSLLKYFKKKGVTAEEMKWTGLETFIRENEPVSRQAMLDFLENNNFELYTVVRASNEYKSELGRKYNEGTREELREILTKDGDLLNDISETLGISKEKILKQPKEALRAYGMNPNEMVAPPVIPDATNWDNWVLHGGANYREYEYIDPRLTGYSNDAMRVHWRGDEDVVVHSRIQDFHESTGRLTSASQNIAQETSRAVQELAQAVEIGDKIDIKIGEHEFHGEPIFSEERYRVVHVDDVGEIAEIKEFSLGQNFSDDFFRDLLYTEPEAYANGGKVLHIEEIQSDWHNAGQKRGYEKREPIESVANRVFADSEGTLKLWSELKQLGLNEELGRQNTYHFALSGGGGLYAAPSGRLSIVTGYDVDDIITKDLGRLPTQEDLRGFVLENDGNINIGDAVPEAPYKSNYTDYAMKRAMREAVEDDYDVITWTTAKQQSDRWSDEFAEGYRIEYDQDIPSFMKKYVAQWGGKVEKIRLAENGEEVWGVRITDEMRDSIKTKGQRRWSKFGIEGATGKQKELGIKAEQMFKDGKAVDKIWDETGWVVDTDGKAKMRFSDEDMSLKVKMKDLKKKSNAEIDTAMKRLDDIEDSINALRRAGKKDDDAEIQSLFGKMQDAYDDYDKAQYGVQEIPLGDLIEHEELFARYPKLADNVTVEFASKSYLDGADGWTERDGDNWRIVVRRGQNKNELTDTLVHEVQHVIQDVEGFSRGASPEEWQKITKEMRSRMDELKSDENKIKEWEKLKKQYDEMTGAYYGSPQGTRDSLAAQGEVQYHNTKGEWEARQAEEERDTPKEFLSAYDAAEADELARGLGRGATGKTYFTNRNEIRVEDYEQYSGTRKYSKMRQEKVQSARSKTRETEKEIAGVDKNLNGKITDARRKELEERRRTLEERLEQEKIELNKLNRPVYQERLERWEKELESLERQKARARGDRLDEINRKITTAKSQITRNKNLIKNEPKKFVSDTPTNKLSDEELTKEYRDLTDNIQKEEWNEIRERDAINKRIESLRKEAEARDLDLRTNLEKADDLVKEKGFGWQEAKRLANEIRDVNKQIAEIKSSGKLTMTKANKIRELKSESDAKGIRLTQVLDNSKSVIPEGKNPIDAFNETVGGNTLKEKGSGKKLNKMSAKKLIEENGSVGGAIKDVGRTIRRKTESSVIEFETAGKQLIRDGEKELGQALLDQTNNVIVYKNKAAAAVETRRASADGTKLGKSLNDVFKVKDKNGKTVDLLLEENAKMRTDLSNYLFAKHSFAREEQGKKVFGIIGEDGKPKWTNASTQEFMDAIVDKYGKETVDSFEKEVRGFIDYLNEYRLDTGLVSKELLDKLNDIYPYYIPTNRAVLNKPPKEYELPKTTAEVENGIKRAVGGDAPLEDLYTQLVKMTMATIRSGEQNKMLAMYAKAKGIESTRLPKDMTAEDVLDTAVTAFDSDHKGNWKIRFYDNGEAVTIPVNRHAAKGLREFNGQDYATLIEVSAKAGKLFHMREYKGLITDWNVVFGVRNGMRDAQQALVNSKDSYWYVRSIPRAMAAISNENNAFRALYDANGGRYSTLQQISRLDEIGALNKNKSTVAKGLQKIEDFNGMIEMKPRMQEFIGTIQKEADTILKDKGGLKGLMEQIEKEAGSIEASKRTEWIEQEYANRVVKLIQDNGKKDIIATAIRNSSDITVNFSRSGVVTKAFNAGFVPYLNPSVQGLSKMMRMFTESKSRGFGVLASFGAKLGVLTIAPAIVNEVLCQGNEAYQSLNTRDKDNNFFIPMSLFGGDKDKFIKIPKPRENAVLAEPFEYGFRYFMDKAQYGTADEWAQMFESAQANVGVVSVWEDNIFSPILNTALNRTWYGGDILSKQELKNIENDEAWKNFDETTTIFAKQMGKLANVSPKKVDAIMDSYLGLIYDFGISQTSQKNINDVYSSPKNFLKNNMFVQQFTKDAVFSNKYATKFWDKVDELNKGHVGDDDTIQKREYMAKYGYDTFTYDTAISGIDNDDTIPKEKKVAMKRELRKYKNQLIKRALDGEEVKYDPMQRIINLYKENGIKNATDKCLTAYAEGDHADAYKTLKRSKEYRDATPAEQRKLQQNFLKTYKGIKRIARFSGDSDNFINYTTAEYVCVKNGYTGGLIANAYAGKSKKYAVEKGMEDMKRYINAGYTEKNFKITMRALNRGANALGDEEKKYASQLDDYDKAMICAKNGYRDGAYLVAGAYIGEARMNAARCLTEGHSGEDFKWTDKRVNKFCKKYEIYQDKKEHTWDLEQVADAVRKEYGNKTPEEQAAVYTVITGDTEHNPFGEIGDYSHKNDSGLLGEEKKKGRGGYGRRGRRGRRGGGGGGGSSKGTMPTTESGAIKAKVTDPFSSSNGTSKSNLNDAYRKRLARLRK